MKKILILTALLSAAGLIIASKFIMPFHNVENTAIENNSFNNHAIKEPKLPEYQQSKFDVLLRLANETSMNRVTWSKIPNVSLPYNYHFFAGQGFPIFSNEMLDENGKLLIFKKGITHANYLDRLPTRTYCKSSESDVSRRLFFTGLESWVQKYATSLVKSPEYDPKVHGDWRNILKDDLNYSGVSLEGARLIGRFINMPDGQLNTFENPNNYNCSAIGSGLSLDQELYPPKIGHWDRADFLGALAQGMGQMKNVRVIELYSEALSTLWQVEQGAGRYGEGISKSQVSNEISNPSNWFIRGKVRGFDGHYNGTGYRRVPYIVYERKYKVDNHGNYILKNGERVFRDDDFTVTNYGHSDRILNSNQHANELSDKGKEHLADGKTDVFFSVHGSYYLADQYLLFLNGLNFEEFKNNDINTHHPDRKLKLSAVRRPRTEPSTWGGLSNRIREIGTDGIRFEILLGLLSGVQLIHYWDDSQNNQAALKPIGQAIYSQVNFNDFEHWNHDVLMDDNYSRTLQYTAAVASFTKAIEGTNQVNWKFIRYHTPILSYKNAECITAGLYTGNDLVITICNPTLDPQETMNIKVIMGNKSETITLHGSKVEFLKFKNIGINLKPTDFKLEYKNIYGQMIRNNGLWTADFSQHYY